MAPPPLARPARPWLTASGLIATAASAVLLLSLAGFAGALTWQLDLLSHFRVQYAVGLGLSAAALLALRRWRWGALIGVGFLVNATTLWPLVAGGNEPATGPSLHVMTFNVLTENQRTEQVLAYLVAEQPDIALLLEVDQRWMTALEPLTSLYRMTAEVRADNFGVALLTRIPADPVAISSAGGDLPLVEATLGWQEQPFRLLGLHTMPPVSGYASQLRDDMLAWAASWVRAQADDMPVLLMGDLNASPWSVAYDALLDTSQLSDSALGFGLQPTWRVGLLGIPIDHVLHSHHWVAIDRWVGPDLGSDHRPLHVRLALTAPEQ